MSNTILDLTHFDVRRIPCRVKHAQIFQRWADLPVGGHFVLINDHDPIPLYYQFAGQYPGAFNWEYLPAPDDEFRVRITRLSDTPAVAMPVRAPVTSGGQQEETRGELDARGLEPPEPMLRILNVVETLSAGESLRARTDRKPIHLLPELDARGIEYRNEEQPDGSWITYLRRR
jgi:uncharacterized protein (DUF2249 family)